MLKAFLDTLNPMNAKRAENALEMMVRVNGATTLVSRASIIEQRVREGAVLVETKHSGLVLQRPDGAFFDARQITKTGLDYANFLLHRARK